MKRIAHYFRGMIKGNFTKMRPFITRLENDLTDLFAPLPLRGLLQC